MASARSFSSSVVSGRALLPSSASAPMRDGAWRTISNASMPPIDAPISRSVPACSASNRGGHRRQRVEARVHVADMHRALRRQYRLLLDPHRRIAGQAGQQQRGGHGAQFARGFATPKPTGGLFTGRLRSGARASSAGERIGLLVVPFAELDAGRGRRSGACPGPEDRACRRAAGGRRDGGAARPDGARRPAARTHSALAHLLAQPRRFRAADHRQMDPARRRAHRRHRMAGADAPADRPAGQLRLRRRAAVAADLHRAGRCAPRPPADPAARVPTGWCARTCAFPKAARSNCRCRWPPPGLPRSRARRRRCSPGPPPSSRWRCRAGRRRCNKAAAICC